MERHYVYMYIHSRNISMATSSHLLVFLLLGGPVPLPPEGEGAAVVGGGPAGPPHGLVGHQLTAGGAALGHWCVCVCVCVTILPQLLYIYTCTCK